MFYALGGSETLVKRCKTHGFFIMILRRQIQKHWQAPKKTKKNKATRCTKHRQAPKKTKKTKFPATIQEWGHSSQIFFLAFFGACQCFGNPEKDLLTKTQVFD